jgi:hypothetical protein
MKHLFRILKEFSDHIKIIHRQEEAPYNQEEIIDKRYFKGKY